jgi:CubicO group peptidase (beta-lactamase class C family)
VMYFFMVLYLLIINSKEHIFDPLGMKTSFFLTPDLKERAVGLAYRDANGTLDPWDNQIEIIEQDPTKGMLKNKISCFQMLVRPWEGSSNLLPWSVRVLLGAIGLYSSMRDYLKLLRHLMQIHGKLQSISFFSNID